LGRTLSDNEQPVDDTFADLGIHDSITSALAEVGIVHPFAIQALAVPLAISGVDLIGQARTGTGKTLAFGVSLLHRMVTISGGEKPAHGRPAPWSCAPPESWPCRSAATSTSPAST